MASVVPESNDRSREVVFVAQSAKACRAQHEVPAVRCGLEPKPPRSQHPNKVATCEKQHIVLHHAYSISNSICAGRDLRWCFASRTAIFEQIPARALG